MSESWRRRAVSRVAFAALVVTIVGSWSATAGSVGSRVLRIPGDGEALAAVSCYDATHCVGVSSGSRQVVTSSDAGRSWTVRRGPKVASIGFTALSCVSARWCVATTNLGTLAPAGASVVVSVDEGRHWRVVWRRVRPRNPDYRLNDVTCEDDRHCLISGTTGAKGFVFSTFDAGRTWSPSRLPGQPANGVIDGLACVTATHCYATQGGRAVLYQSRDGGRTWSSTVVPATFRRYEGEAGVLTGLTAVSCGSPSFCVAGGFIAQTRLQGTTEPFKWVTTDGGASWTFDEPFAATGAKSPSALSVGGISCESALRCELGLSYGYVYVTTDGGRSWARDEGAPHADSNVLSLDCVTPSYCIASVISNFPSKRLLEGSLWLLS